MDTIVTCMLLIFCGLKICGPSLICENLYLKNYPLYAVNRCQSVISRSMGCFEASDHQYKRVVIGSENIIMQLPSTVVHTTSSILVHKV